MDETQVVYKENHVLKWRKYRQNNEREGTVSVFIWENYEMEIRKGND